MTRTILLRDTLWVGAPYVYTPDSWSHAADAVDTGRLTADEAEALGIDRVPAATSGVGPDLAVAAARQCLTRSTVAPDRLQWLVHAWTHHQGHDLWSPAHYVAHGLGLPHVVPFGIQQVCNGGSLAVSVAGRLLDGDGLALVTTGDRFSDDGFDRWAGDYGIAYGDGGTAAIVSRTALDGGWRVLSTAHTAAPELELMHRGDDDLTTAAGLAGPVDARRTKRAYLERFGKDAFSSLADSRLCDVVSTVLADVRQRWGLHEPARTAGPRLGRMAVDTIYAERLGLLTNSPHRFTSTDTGHLGAGDMIANLAHLDANAPGSGWTLLVTAGAGFSWTAMAVTRDS